MGEDTDGDVGKRLSGRAREVANGKWMQRSEWVITEEVTEGKRRRKGIKFEWHGDWERGTEEVRERLSSQRVWRWWCDPSHPLSLICVVQNRAYICGHTPAPPPLCGFCWPCKPLSTLPFYFCWWITNKLSQSQNGLCHPCSRGLVRFCYLHANRATPPKETPHHHVNPACIRTRTRTLHQPLLPLIQSVVSCVYFILGVYL